MKNDKSKDVQFIRPINKIKAKVGSGGLAADIIDNAQKIVEEYTKDFPTIANTDLKKIADAIEELNEGVKNQDEALYKIHGAAVDLKSNSGMFNKKLIEKMSINLASFTENLKEFDDQIKEIILAHYNGIKVMIDNLDNPAIIKHGETVLKELASLIDRYYKKKSKEE